MSITGFRRRAREKAKREQEEIEKKKALDTINKIFDDDEKKRSVPKKKTIFNE
jgi:hypothetical protein